MSVSFDGVGQVCATFLGSGLGEGQVVRMAGNGTVCACGDGESFCGVTLCCKDDACTVQVRGFVTVRYSGAAPGTGWRPRIPARTTGAPPWRGWTPFSASSSASTST